MTDLNNKTVLITGAGGGFGREMTRQFLAAGSKLVLTDLLDSTLQPVADIAGEHLVAAVAADLATQEGCGIIAGTCAARDIVPDVLLNNAGIGFSGRLDHVPREQWETLMQLNMMAPIRLTNQFLPGMIERGSGHIVNISSLAGWIGAPGLTTYCASKFGLRGFGVSLSADLEDTGVVVSNVYPCFSRTAILDSPQYGNETRWEVPENLISEPADVVVKMIEGIRKNKLHIFPDKHARRIYYLQRFFPGLIPIFNRRMKDAAVRAAKESD